MTSRLHPAASYNGLKTAVKRVLGDVGGIDAAAACTRGSRSLFSEYGSVTSDRQIPIDVALDLETVTGVPHVTAALAAAHGYELVRIGKPRAAEHVAVALSRVGDGMAVLFGDTARALAVGQVSGDAAGTLTDDLENVGRLVSDALALLRFRQSNQGDGDV